MHAPTASSVPPDLVAVKRALISVSDKTGIVEFARALQQEFEVELVSTGGTAKTLREAGLKVQDISDLTGFPEMMDGRVKTLHPLVHGGFLALRDNADHLAAMRKHNIQPIDLVCVNLYPFEQTVAKPGCTFEEAIENIDIGGPAMIRSASKNHRSIVVVTDAIQYEKVLKHMRRNAGMTPYKFRLDLAMWAYSKTAQYDAAIYPYLGQAYFKDNPEKLSEAAGLTPLLTPRLKKIEDLRYGENPHQFGAFYKNLDSHATGIATAAQLHGKALSYINILDADAAIELVREFPNSAAAVIKHTNPCGCATASTLAAAFDLAYAGDPVAAFGGIVALNREVDEKTAAEIVSGKRFLEVVIAPSYAPAALAMLKDRWKDCRILATGPLSGADARVGSPPSTTAPSPEASSSNNPTSPASTNPLAPSPVRANPPKPNGSTSPSSGSPPSTSNPPPLPSPKTASSSPPAQAKCPAPCPPKLPSNSPTKTATPINSTAQRRRL